MGYLQYSRSRAILARYRPSADNLKGFGGSILEGGQRRWFSAGRFQERGDYKGQRWHGHQCL